MSKKSKNRKSKKLNESKEIEPTSAPINTQTTGTIKEQENSINKIPNQNNNNLQIELQKSDLKAQRIMAGASIATFVLTLIVAGIASFISCQQTKLSSQQNTIVSQQNELMKFEHEPLIRCYPTIEGENDDKPIINKIRSRNKDSLYIMNLGGNLPEQLKINVAVFLKLSKDSANLRVIPIKDYYDASEFIWSPNEFNDTQVFKNLRFSEGNYRRMNNYTSNLKSELSIPSSIDLSVVRYVSVKYKDVYSTQSTVYFYAHENPDVETISNDSGKFIFQTYESLIQSDTCISLESVQPKDKNIKAISAYLKDF